MARLTKLTFIAIVVRKVFHYINHSFGWLVSRFRGPDKASAQTSPKILSKFHRHMITNMLVGLTIAIGLHFMHHSAYVSQLEDTAIDWTMQMYRGTIAKDNSLPIAFIDIDDSTYLAWNEPLLTPRDKLAKLIEYAIDGKPKAIVVDIDLSRSDKQENEFLKSVLKNYVSDKDDSKTDVAPLILTKVLKAQSLKYESTKLPDERTTSLDSLVAEARNIFWAVSIYDLETDGKVRRWHLWEAVCNTQGEPYIYPSVQLLIKALAIEGIKGTESLFAILQELTPQSCDFPVLSSNKTNAQTSTKITASENFESMYISLGGKQVDLQPEQTGRRIVYRIPWLLNQGESRPLITVNESQQGAVKVPQVSTLSAGIIADSKQPLNSEWLRDHLVIIGSSHTESRDLYQTPIGIMPGALVIANAIQSFDAHGELRTPGLLETLMIEAFLIAVMSYLFARFDSFWGSLFSGAVVLLTLLPISLWLFNSGFWLSFAIPLFAVYIHEIAAELEGIMGRHKSQGHEHD